MSLIILLIPLVVLNTVSALISDCPNCGNLQVPYPLSTSKDCGDSRYRVYCNNESLEFLSASGFYYKILKIEPTSYKLVISPPEILINTCISSDLPEGGLLLDENQPFNISTNNVVMLLNCSDNILQSPLNCSSNSICRDFEENVKEGSGCMNTLCCHYVKDSSMTSHRIRVRVGSCTAYTSLVNYIPKDSVSSWSYGIELQWMPPN